MLHARRLAVLDEVLECGERAGADPAQALIDDGAPVDAFDEVWGRQALRIAVQNGRPASARRLREHGADPSLRDKEGLTALDWCRPERRYLDGPGHREVEAILGPSTR